MFFEMLTQNDKLKLLKPGSLQHLGENMLAFLIHSAMSSNLKKEMEVKKEDAGHSKAIFFDILVHNHFRACVTLYTIWYFPSFAMILWWYFNLNWAIRLSLSKFVYRVSYKWHAFAIASFWIAFNSKFIFLVCWCILF